MASLTFLPRGELFLTNFLCWMFWNSVVLLDNARNLPDAGSIHGKRRPNTPNISRKVFLRTVFVSERSNFLFFFTIEMTSSRRLFIITFLSSGNSRYFSTLTTVTMLCVLCSFSQVIFLIQSMIRLIQSHFSSTCICRDFLDWIFVNGISGSRFLLCKLFDLSRCGQLLPAESSRIFLGKSSCVFSFNGRSNFLFQQYYTKSGSM